MSHQMIWPQRGGIVIGDCTGQRWMTVRAALHVARAYASAGDLDMARRISAAISRGWRR